MSKEEVKLKAETLLEEISFKAPLHYEECIEVALLIVDKILEENPTRIYWDTYDDETPSAVTVWNEVKSELEALKLN
jgi:hypothetical protein